MHGAWRMGQSVVFSSVVVGNQILTLCAIRFTLCLSVFPDEQQRIAGDAQAAQQHCRHGNQGGEQAAHGNRDADGVVNKRKK